MAQPFGPARRDHVFGMATDEVAVKGLQLLTSALVNSMSVGVVACPHVCREIPLPHFQLGHVGALSHKIVGNSTD